MRTVMSHPQRPAAAGAWCATAASPPTSRPPRRPTGPTPTTSRRRSPAWSPSASPTGDEVEAGQTIATIEAMKMEAAITAPKAGTVDRVAVSATAQVEGGDLLVVVSLTRIVAGTFGGRRITVPRTAGPGRPPIGCANRCSTCWHRGWTSTGWPCSTCTRVRGAGPRGAVAGCRRRRCSSNPITRGRGRHRREHRRARRAPRPTVRRGPRRRGAGRRRGEAGRSGVRRPAL